MKTDLFIFRDPEGKMSSPKPYKELVAAVTEAGAAGEILHVFLTPFAESKVYAEIKLRTPQEILSHGTNPTSPEPVEELPSSPVREAAPAVPRSPKRSRRKGRKGKALPSDGGSSA
jgi:hypothetical protein